MAGLCEKCLLQQAGQLEPSHIQESVLKTSKNPGNCGAWDPPSLSAFDHPARAHFPGHGNCVWSPEAVSSHIRNTQLQSPHCPREIVSFLRFHFPAMRLWFHKQEIKSGLEMSPPEEVACCACCMQPLVARQAQGGWGVSCAPGKIHGLAVALYHLMVPPPPNLICLTKCLPNSRVNNLSHEIRAEIMTKQRPFCVPVCVLELESTSVGM